MLGALLWLAAVAPLAPAEDGLVAWYPCDEGQGEVVHDQSGNGLHGSLAGCVWERYGDGYCLRFDGVDDQVDFGDPAAFRVGQAVTVEAWLKPEGVPSGEPGIVGKQYASYVLTYYADGRCWWYVGGGGSNVNAAVAAGAWHHVVGTFAGGLLRLYVDGREAGSRKLTIATVPPAPGFFFGTSTGEAEFTRGAHYRGLLDEVRVFSRALTAEEVAKRHRTSHLSGAIDLDAEPATFSGELTVLLNLRGLGELPAGTICRVDLRRGGESLATASVPVAEPELAVTLKLPEPRPGELTLEAVAEAGGEPLGKPSLATVAWPERPVWPDAPRARVLNNLVAELADAGAPVPGKLIVTMPRDGWLFLAATARGAAPAVIKLDGTEVLRTAAVGTVEAMRCVAKGDHELTVDDAGGLDRLIARSIPELAFASYGANPHVTEYGRYDGAFLDRYVAPNTNVLVGPGGERNRAVIEAWHRQGKRWVGSAAVPGTRTAITADEAEAYWRKIPGLTDPLLDGSYLDEFNGYDAAHYDAWAEALRRIGADPALRAKRLYPYGGVMASTPHGRRFCETVIAAGGKFGFERYLMEPPDEVAAQRIVRTFVSLGMDNWERALPGAARHVVYTIGTFSQPPESLNVCPWTDYRVFLDMQFHALANSPSCFGLYGLQSYLSSYSDEETVRWVMRLFRHYCLDGRSDRLAVGPYRLDHLTNPDFADGTAGWTLAEAEPGAITAGRADGFGFLQGRYPDRSAGQSVLTLRRSAGKANQVTQTIRNLSPGRPYSLKLFCADAKEMGVKQKLGLAVNLEGVAVDREHSFQHVFPNCYSHHFGPFDDRNRAWMNYFWIVFTPAGQEARLTISDWVDGRPGGPAGQEIMFNFVEVQSYLAP